MTHNVVAYTDGASSGNPGPAGAAAYFPATNQLYAEGLWHTNNYAEMTAAILAVQHAPRGCNLTIVTDSKLVIGWLSQSWKVNHKHIAELIVGFHQAREFNDVVVTFELVKGHDGNMFNDLVDREARHQASLMKQLASQRV